MPVIVPMHQVGDNFGPNVDNAEMTNVRSLTLSINTQFCYPVASHSFKSVFRFTSGQKCAWGISSLPLEKLACEAGVTATDGWVGGRIWCLQIRGPVADGRRIRSSSPAPKGATFA